MSDAGPQHNSETLDECKDFIGDKLCRKIEQAQDAAKVVYCRAMESAITKADVIAAVTAAKLDYIDGLFEAVARL